MGARSPTTLASERGTVRVCRALGRVDASGRPALDSCTSITTGANHFIRPMHLLILSSADCDLWLDPSVQDPERLQSLLRPYRPEDMVAYPVSTRVNSQANDTPDCIAPVAA